MDRWRPVKSSMAEQTVIRQSETTQSTHPTPPRILREGGGSRPEVRLEESGQGLSVVKDFSSGNGFCRAVGRYLIWREKIAYQRLDGISGIPKWHGCPNSHAMSTEYFPGEDAASAPVELLTPAFYERLIRLITVMHDRGVAHADLKRLENILVSADSEPALIDFSAAFVSGSNPLTALAFPHLFDDDLRAVYKLKFRRTPWLLTPEEEVFLNHRSMTERAFRFLRDRARVRLQRLAGSEPQPPPIRR